MKKLYASALALAAMSIAAVPAEAVFRFDPRAAIEGSAGSASIGSRVAAPFGSIVFCKNNPSQCAVRRGSGVAVSDGRIVYSDEIMATLRSVNRSVNRSINPVAESSSTNADRWRVGASSGDCEDYALTKRASLLRRGFPSSAALVATGETRQGRAHAVLVVRTDRGDYVLDSKTDSVVPFSSAPYSWDSIQSPQNPRIWSRL